MNAISPESPPAAEPGTAAAVRLPRIVQGEGGVTRLSRRLGPLRGFPQSLPLSGRSVTVVGEPELILLVDLMRPAEGEYRHRRLHDVICQVVLAHAGVQCTINVNLASSRITPSTEASVVTGSVRPPWLNLADADDVICSLPACAAVRGRFADSIKDFIARWVTEYSLRSLAALKDETVVAALRARDKTLYSRLIAWLDSMPGTSVDTISKHLRSALVDPDTTLELLAHHARKPADAPRPHAGFERTLELRGERNRRDAA